MTLSSKEISQALGIMETILSGDRAKELTLGDLKLITKCTEWFEVVSHEGQFVAAALTNEGFLYLCSKFPKYESVSYDADKVRADLEELRIKLQEQTGESFDSSELEEPEVEAVPIPTKKELVNLALDRLLVAIQNKNTTAIASIKEELALLTK